MFVSTGSCSFQMRLACQNTWYILWQKDFTQLMEKCDFCKSGKKKVSCLFLFFLAHIQHYKQFDLHTSSGFKIEQESLHRQLQPRAKWLKFDITFHRVHPRGERDGSFIQMWTVSFFLGFELLQHNYQIWPNLPFPCVIIKIFFCMSRLKSAHL